MAVNKVKFVNRTAYAFVNDILLIFPVSKFCGEDVLDELR